MAVTKLSFVSVCAFFVCATLCANVGAKKLSGSSQSRNAFEGPHIRNLGYSGNIPEPKVSIVQNHRPTNHRKLPKGESCHEESPQCAKVLHPTLNPRISKARDTGTGNEPIHPGPLKIEIRNLNLKPIKNSTSTDISPRGNLNIDVGFSIMSNFIFKTIVTLIFVKTIEFVFGGIWKTAWKYAGWATDDEYTSITLGGFGHPFAHYSTGWDSNDGGWGNSYGHNPYAFSYHDHSLHRPTGNIYYPGNKYYAGSHTDVKALKKAAKKYGKKKYKGSKYWLQPIEHHHYDKRKR